ncbi:hypothetical protein BB558_000595 [Smittium angustum]|uniref:Uncharacterized protein n=1 Tax=Smittium angustum TaxID=133377 RepID=A0A2U1JDU9_SMIAN|nr:hypothetical protein BB558_000595 [Smittium angustum]
MNKACKQVFAVIGTTGVGKSKLGIELAKAINGEVINSDSLQVSASVYKGYDIITNKVTTEEMDGIPHHLLGFLDVDKQYTVQDFEVDANKKIEELTAKNKNPILVGGTNYYVQSILFNKSLVTKSSRNGSENIKKTENDTYLNKNTCDEESDSEFIINNKKISEYSNQELIDQLYLVDPEMSRRWHPNNRRKVIRSLQVYYETGKSHSSWIKESEEALKSDEVLRFPSCVFWLYSKPDDLNKRLDSRVDQMISSGLFQELDKFKEFINETKKNGLSKTLDNDYSFGIKQAIGFKEFQQYLDEKEKGNKELDQIKNECIDEMKRNTRKYAKKQVSWIKNKLLPIYCESKQYQKQSHLYILDATDLSRWDSSVKDVAVDIAKKFIGGGVLPEPSGLSEVARELMGNDKTKVPKAYIGLAIASILSILVFFNIGARFIVNVIGFGYSAIASINAIESTTKEDDTQWLTYWVIYGSLNLAEYFSGFILYWIPYYYVLKLFFIIYLMHPKTRGAERIYFIAGGSIPATHVHVSEIEVDVSEKKKS